MNDDRLYLPAEWAVQSGVQLTWPHAGTDWAPYLDEITETYLQLADAITRHEALLVVSPEVEHVRELLEARLGRARMDRVVFACCDTDDTWARDHGAITLMGGDEPVLLDFRFNGWGEKFGWQHDNAITRHLCEQGLLHGSREDHDDMVLEGGSIESDGRGTVFTTSQCLLAPHRNQPLSREEIDAELRRRLRARRVVWINHGNLVGDDTDGHIDTIVRICPDNTLLYVGCDDENDPQYADLKALENQLQQATDADGKPYRLLKLPMPDALYDNGDRLPATYANFLIINGAVIVPTYNQEENDARALELVAEAFPGYDIIGIDSQTIVRQHGSIHCLTMQYPVECTIPSECR